MNAARLVELAPDVGWVALEQTTSTNDEARRLALSDAPHGTAVVADYQTAGRGRLGRRWVAPPGANVLLSLVLRDGLRAERLGMTSLAAAVGAAEAVGPEWRLDWPNDVVDATGRKLAGILAEAEWAAGRPAFVVVGIGVNVHASPPDVPAVCLADFVSGPSREGVAAAVARGVLAWARRSDADIRAAWRQRAFTLGKRVAVGGVMGTAVDIAEDGALVLDTGDGTHLIRTGDVHLVG